MAKKKQPVLQGAPEWVLTYGDMMSLLLCFFVILFSLSEIKEDKKVKDILDSLREAFGTPTAGIGPIEANDPPKNTIEKLLQEWQRPIEKLNRGHATMEAPQGKYTEVRRINEGLDFIVGKGGRTPFARGSAEIEPDFKPELRELAKLMRGYNNVISVRGHCSLNDFAPNAPRKDFDNLSFARAEAIKDYLIDTCGLEAKRIRTVACGDIQPMNAQAYDEEEHAQNRRVEVIFRQVLVDDYAAAGSSGESGE